MMSAALAEPSWELFAAFLAVMQHGSLSAAARAMQLAQPTVRRQIEALEAQLGVVLFTRAPNGLVPTELARATLPHAEAVAASTRALLRAVSAPAEEERGVVRLAASEIVGIEVLPVMLARLNERHPGLCVELVLSNRNEDLLRRDADLAVRMMRPTQVGLLARRAARIELGLYASEAHLARRGAPRTLAELTSGEPRLVGGDRARGLAEALAAAGLPTKPSDYVLRSDNDAAQLAAVRAGLGIGVCQAPLAARAPEGAPGLRRVLPALRFALEAFVVMHEDLRRVRRVRLVFDHLVAELGRYAPPSAGGSGAPIKRSSTRRAPRTRARR